MLQSRLRFAVPDVLVTRRDDGSMLVESPTALRPFARATGQWLAHWAQARPDTVFLAERPLAGASALRSQAGPAGWRCVTYRDAFDAARRIGQSLIERGLTPATPIAVLSDNSLDHALLALGAMQVGVPIAPISPAYSLLSKDHAKLRHIFALLEPALVHCADAQRFAPALAAVGAVSTSLDELLDATPDQRLEAASARVGPDSIAKILFTSGSTGMPKGVINTHRMLCANQQQAAQSWQFLDDEPPVIVDWLPWNHTFGGNFSFNLVLRNGGTLYIDGGKPMPGMIETTVRNLKEIAPNLYFNVPRGFDLLMPFLENDAQLRRHFFSRCRFVFYAGAALPQNLWQRFEALAQAERDGEFALVSAWGSTETAPLATAVHFPIDRAGVVGLPVAGCTLKLVPSAGKLEVRVKGANVMPGYYRRDDLSAQAFDEEGYYRIGDAMRFVDPARPVQGLSFDGRVAEDFKLRTGTWVHVGGLRLALIAAADPLLQDAVITGHDRDEIGALLFLNPAACAGVSPEQLRSRLAGALAALSAGGSGSSGVIARALILAEPPRMDAGEITDKGYLNQRAVLDARAAEVQRLYGEGSDIIRLAR